MESAKRNLTLIETRTDTISLEEKDPTTASDPANHEVLSQERADHFSVASRQSQFEKLDTEIKVDKTQLINKLNFINFQDGTVSVNFKHLRYDKKITLKATPQPCMGDLVDCLWIEDKNITQILQSYRFSNILITNGQKLLKVEPEVIRIDAVGISVLLPETCTEISSRKARRYLCQGISVQLIQNSTVFSGTLMDFNGFSFRVKLTAAPPQTFDWVNPEHPVNVILSGRSGHHLHRRMQNHQTHPRSKLKKLHP